MKLLVTHEVHTKQIGDKFYNPTGVLSYKAFTNYMYKTNDICLVVRSRPAEKAEDNWLEISGPGIEVRPIYEPYSTIQLLIFWPVMVWSIIKTIKKCDRYMVRLPGPTGMMVSVVLLLMGKKYGAEFVGHASESYFENRPNTSMLKLRCFLLNSFVRFLVKHAYCVAYRSNYLRQEYPNKHKENQWIFSGAQLDKEAIGSPKEPHFFKQSDFNIMFVGRVMAEKGVKYLVEAVGKLRSKTTKNIKLHIVGDGAEVEALKKQSVELGIGDAVLFYGRVEHGKELFDILDTAQLFVLPSLSEGMPRSLIEAMARGIPAIGSKKGGIPELLKPQYLFVPGSGSAIASKILEFISDTDKLVEMSKENFEASKQHWFNNLKKAKDGFWQMVMEDCK